MFRRIHTRWLVVAAGAMLLSAGPAHAAMPCDADLDGDGDVGILDLLTLLSAWGTDPGGPPDFDADGVVGVLDLLTLLANWGPMVFDYGPGPDNPEAQQIGLEMMGASGGLLVPKEEYLRIDRDLGLIRNAEPALQIEIHSPAWVPSQLLVGLVKGAPQDAYLCLNVIYQVTNVEHLFGSWYLLTFAGNLNVAALAAIYEEAPEVQFAEPNLIIGGQNFWVPTPLGEGVWRWEIDDGWHDCFDGCDCHRFYFFETDDKFNVTLISFQEVGAPWCEFAG